MKKVMIPVLMTFLIFNIASSLRAETNIYTSPYFNFTISYPSDWESKEISGIIAFLSPREDADDFSENVNVVVEDISNYPMTLENYVNLGFKNWQKVNKNIKLLKKSKTQIDDRDAFYIICDDGDLKYKQYIFIYNLKAYVLTYTGKRENFDKYLNQAEAIMQSIRISL